MPVASMKALVKKLRTRYWYECVRVSMGESTAYALEEIFEPKRFDAGKKRLGQAKKWPRYRSGARKPSAKLVNSVEEKAPGTQKALNAPLWTILLAEDMTTRRAEAYIATLEPKIQAVMSRWLETWQTSHVSRLRHTQGRSLVRAGRLDGLAGLILMWLVYRKHAQQEAMRIVARLIYQAMLMVGADFWSFGLADDLLQVVCMKVFDNTCWEHGKCKLSAQIYSQGIDLLGVAHQQVEDKSLLRTKDGVCRLKQNLLSGKLGYDGLYGLAIPLSPDWKDGPPTRDQYRAGMGLLLQWAWGWTHLSNHSIGRLPLDNLWKFLEENLGEMEFPFKV
jgi:hypothetical protein